MDGQDLIKHRWYEALWKAYQQAKPTDSLTNTIGAIPVAQAYEVQAMLVENRIRAGERIIGWKVGATSRPVMDQLGLDEPVFGCMTSGSNFSAMRQIKVSDFCKLAIEGEIAFVMQEAVMGPGVTNADVLMGAAGIMGAVELVDCRIKDWRVNTSEAVADNAFHAGVILGPLVRPIQGLDLRHEGVIITKNGRLLGSGCGVEALGNPVHVVTWLADKLSSLGKGIEPGEIILTGSLTPFFFVEPNDVVEVSFSSLGSIQFTVSR